MAVIKSTNAPPALTAFSMRDIEAQATALLRGARRAAEQLLVQAQVEAESLKQQAHAEGMVQGQAEGLAKGLEEGRRSGHEEALNDTKGQLTAVWSALTAAVTQLESARIELESAGVVEVIELAAGIARRVTKRQAAIDPAVLTANIREAMNLAVHAADLRIVINPAQRATLVDELPKLQLIWPSLQHVEMVDDPAVSPGGCRIMTRHGEVDAQIEGQLDRVIADLMPREQVTEQ
jgi:flagellar assembly protein FliH